MASLILEDIAKLAGVSRATVSRVVNHQPNVREEVRKRVQDVIRTTGYRPNAAARSLASARSWTIGLLLPQSVSGFFTDPYYPHLIKGVAQGCNLNGYTLALFLVESKEDEDEIFPRVSRRGLLDGLIVQSGHHGDQSIIGHLVDAKVPFVVAGRPFRSDNVSYIDIDNENAAYVATSHLIRLGYQRIGTISGPATSTVGIDRNHGYLRALTDHGLAPDSALCAEGDFTEMGGYFGMQCLIPQKPDAIFAASDIMAVGAMQAAREMGLRVPEDVAFVGFDDLPFASLANSQLTTIRQPVVEFGIKAVDMLIDLMENGIDPPRHLILETELIIHKSCGSTIRPPKES